MSTDDAMKRERLNDFAFAATAVLLVPRSVHCDSGAFMTRPQYQARSEAPAA